MKTYFAALVDRAQDGTYGAMFPDVPGCYSSADTLEEMASMAEEALALHLEVLTENGLDMPRPSNIERLTKPRGHKTMVVLLVPARSAARPKRINITLDPRLTEEIDTVSANRSAFIAEACRAELARRNRRHSTGPVKSSAQARAKPVARKAQAGRPFASEMKTRGSRNGGARSGKVTRGG